MKRLIALELSMKSKDATSINSRNIFPVVATASGKFEWVNMVTRKPELEGTKGPMETLSPKSNLKASI